MGLLDRLRGRSVRRSIHLVVRIADEPQIVPRDGVRYMIFHLVEVPGREFRIKMLPTTPKRRRGERIDLTYQQSDDEVAWVETMSSAPDADSNRMRNQEYLASIQARNRQGL